MSESIVSLVFVAGSVGKRGTFGGKIMHANTFVLLFGMKETKSMVKRRKQFTLLSIFSYG